MIAGRYELGERLGVGGMSTVQVAFDRRLERDVAVKLLAEHLADDPLFVTRFRREALAAAQLVHPNIVQVFDFGLDEASGRQYIVMEVVRGKSGAEILRAQGRLPVGEAIDLVAQSCVGLQYAHRNGVIHRDVKPGNLLRSEEGVVKLADFGIAKAFSEESSITQVGSVLGTASYLAPEQARGEEAGAQADIYALGVVTYQLLSGRLPYEATSLTELALRQQRESPPYLHEMDPAIPVELSHAVDRALALEPGDRWGSAEAMRTGLIDGAKGVSTETGVTRVVGGPDAEHTQVTSATRAAPDLSPPTAQTAAARQPRQPRQPRPGAVPVAASAPAPVPARRGRARRTFTTFFVLLILVGAGAAAVIATSNSSSAVHLRQVTGNKVGDIVQSLTDLIDANTR
jgi:serine/threonine-protein kinase